MSCYAYATRGAGRDVEVARQRCAQLKNADRAGLARFAAQVWELNRGGGFASVFGHDVVLVPVPGSGIRPSGPWVGERLAWCLTELGLARAVWTVLRRRHAVRKSAFAAPGERPSVYEHFESFGVQLAQSTVTVPGGARLELLPQSTAGDRPGWGVSRPAVPRVVLVDDIVTRGRTLLAAAARLRQIFPGSDICAFALMRTLGREEPLRHDPDPCQGWVRWLAGDARRIP